MPAVRTIFLDAGTHRASLSDVARCVFDALGISDREERFSANYPPDEHYFKAYARNASVLVSDADGSIKAGYAYTLSVEAPQSWRLGMEDLTMDVDTVAHCLSKAGLHVFVPTGPWWSPDWDGERIEYEV